MEPSLCFWVVAVVNPLISTVLPPSPAVLGEAETDPAISYTAEKVVTILVSLENGRVVYRDTDNQEDEGMVTHAGYGTQVIWKLDPQSGLKAITNVTLNGDLFMLAELPRQVDEETWVARVGTKGKGEVSYIVEVEKCRECADAEVAGDLELRDLPMPILRMP